jgi:type IV secretory pathway VirB10-like protein
MFIGSDATVCPECGAFEDETVPPVAEAKYNIILGIVVAAVALLALLAISTSPNGKEQQDNGIPSLQVEDVPPPTPVPTPTPVVVLQPTPVPQIKPTPKPNPVPPTPTPFNPAPPTPTPVPPPKPTPTPRRSRTLELKDQLIEEYRQALDESHPMSKQGEFIRLTLTDGRNVSGTIDKKDNQQLLLDTETGKMIIVYRQLVTESRIRVDMSERNARLEEKALQEVLRRLQDL